jgi:manganese transport protein
MASQARSSLQGRSLEDIHRSVLVPKKGWKQLFAFAGPAFLVSVGYMDPGNWGADIQAGSSFGFRLLWVLVMSNLMALLLQGLATRLGVVTGRDLAQACRDSYARPTVLVLWLLSELAIAATDLAEVIGTIIALRLLFQFSYFTGLVIAALDTFLLLALQRRGVRALEAVTLILIAVIGGSFCVELFNFPPPWSALGRGFLPTLDPNHVSRSLYVAIAMLGATVMPHNLYLHSALVQTRDYPNSTDGRRRACKYYLLDSLLALNGAFFINAAILVLSATIFFPKEVETLTEAHSLLQRVWSKPWASGLFALALLASGQSSTLTGTLAGQIVMEGFVNLRLRPWLRRMVTRLIAIVPALMVIGLASRTSGGTSSPESVSVTDHRLLELLVLSQVILSLQLPFAIIPLVQFTSDRRRMGEFASRVWLKICAWSCALIVLGLNLFLICFQMTEWGRILQESGWSPWWVYGTLGPLTLALLAFLGWMSASPFLVSPVEKTVEPAVPVLGAIHYRRIGVAVEFEGSDDAVLEQGLALARDHQAELVVLHVVEGLGASYLGAETRDQESRIDESRMEQMVNHLRQAHPRTEGYLGYGDPPEQLVRLAEEQALNLLVLGTHGHRFFADLALGQTVSPLLHRLTIPVLVVPAAQR